MTAGRGIVHAEMPGTDTIEGLQLWVNLKSTDKLCEPNYQESPAENLVKIEREGVEAVVVAGQALGESSPLLTKTPAYYIILNSMQILR